MTKASAEKRGRNPQFPYVPILVHGGYYDANDQWVTRWTQNTRTVAAFATRKEAVEFAQKCIDLNAR
jgi:hypothetical protein